MLVWYAWYMYALKQYAVFSGRASRREFWTFTLTNILILMVWQFLSVNILIISTDLESESTKTLMTAMAGIFGLIHFIFTLAVLIPNFAVTVRRLHDIGRSGFWFLIIFIPFIGQLTLFIFTVIDSQPGDNQYGPNPHDWAAQYAAQQTQQESLGIHDWSQQ